MYRGGTNDPPAPPGAAGDAENPFKFPKEEYDTPEDALGLTGCNVELEYVQTLKTREMDWREAGYTEHIIYKGSDGNYYHVYRNKSTGKYSGGGSSSHNPAHVD